MRLPLVTIALGAVLACSGEGADPGGPAGAGGSGGTPCTELACFRVDCAEGTTSLTGVVHAPEGTLPLPGVVVYVPREPPAELVDGAACAPCTDDGPPGALVWTTTDVEGRFRLDDVPATTSVPLVIETGRWRRIAAVPEVPACTTTEVDPGAIRLPRDSAEGHLPRIAVATGGGDTLECLVRKLGIAGAEIAGGGAARVHLYAGKGGTSRLDDAHGGATLEPAASLWTDAAALAAHDLVLLACEGDHAPEGKSAQARDAMKAYADGGGRVLASHFQDLWLTAGPEPWPSLVTFDEMQDDLHDVTASVDPGTPRAATFYPWLANAGGGPAGTLDLLRAKHHAVGVDGEKVQRWIHLEPEGLPPSIQLATFSTPVESGGGCGRFAFTDLHAATGETPGEPFPSGCVTTGFTGPELALAYMVFELGRCVP